MDKVTSGSFMSNDTTLVSSSSMSRNNTNSSVASSTSRLQTLSQDLLHQAFQEVGGGGGNGAGHEVKLEADGDMFGLLSGTTPGAGVTSLDMGPLTTHSHSPLVSVAGAGLDKVKLEPVSAPSPVILIPSVQRDGTVAYTVQQQHVPGLGPSAAITAHTVSSPVKSSSKVAIQRNPSKQKVILPKTCQHTPSISTVSHRLNQSTQNLVPVAPYLSTPSTGGQKLVMGPTMTSPGAGPIQPAILRRKEASVRKVQLITGTEGETRNIEIVSSNGEVSVSSDKPLSRLELQHVQSIIRHQKESGTKEAAKQIYRVMYPPPPSQQTKSEKVASSKTIELVNLEEEVSLDDSNTEAEQPFSVAALVKEISKRGRGKNRSRGRPRKGTPKVINEKKVLTELRRELGLREVKVKEFGLVEDSSETQTDDNEFDSTNSARTRSGRLSRPPPRIRKPGSDMENNYEIEEDQEPGSCPSHGVTGAVTNMNLTPPPKVENNIPLPNRRNFVPPAKYICKVCGKLYLGEKKIAKHLKHFPSHEFATPEPPQSPIVKETRKSPSFDAYIADCEPNKFIEQVGPKLYKSFSLWDLLVKKTISKRLGTAESLMSLLADMQAIVIELKNLVEQCLSCERTNEDSFSVTLTPIMSSVLGLSQSGGVTRYVLPYTQVPEHYHKLLSFPTGLASSSLVSSVTSTTDPNLMSPESTTSLIHPEEENSQMSLSSDILDQPLCDKVVLEDNLGSSQMLQDMDEETQDSSLTAPSPVLPLKRARLDSETHSVTSPPPQTPDFLSQGEDSNLSSLSTSVTEPSQTLALADIAPSVSSSKRRRTSVEILPSTSVDTLHTKLPSFSSIINGSPKEESEESSAMDHNSDSNEHRLDEDIVVVEDSPPKPSLYSRTASSAAADVCTTLSSNFTQSAAKSPSKISNPLVRLSCLNQDTFGVASDRSETIGGSAPVSPRVSYGPLFNRRCSLDNVNRSAPEAILIGLASKLQDSSPSPGLMDIPLTNLDTDAAGQNTFQRHGTESAASNKLAPVAEADGALADSFEFQAVSSESASSQPELVTWGAAASSKTSPLDPAQGKTIQLQNSIMEAYPKISTPTSFSHEFAKESEHRDTFSHCSVSSSEFEHSIPSIKSSILKAVPKSQASSYTPGSSTHVTFSEELTHPIPSVSPAKDFREIDLKRQNPTPPSESQSSSIFSDLESVLNEATEFSFHPELAGAERCRVKTPEKMLASVPPAAIMDKKSTISFDNILHFEKSSESKTMSHNIDHVGTNQEPILPANILENSPNFPFTSSSGGDGNC